MYLYKLVQVNEKKKLTKPKHSQHSKNHKEILAVDILEKDEEN